MEICSQATALRRQPPGDGERARFWREAHYDGLECLSASFRTHIYERHTHATYVIGCIVAGCERFEVAGVHYAARPGHLCFINPDTVHDGRPDGDGYAYRMIYPSLDLISEMVADLSGRAPRQTLTFGEPVVRDGELSAAFVAAHRALEAKQSRLDSDEMMVQILGRILKRHGRLSVDERPAHERRAVKQAKEFLMANIAAKVDLVTLASVAGLSRGYLIRAFKAETGLTPHAFLIDQRVRLARTLLLEGDAPVDVAIESGFADQAHMTRAFKARIGVTPGSFARMI